MPDTRADIKNLRASGRHTESHWDRFADAALFPEDLGAGGVTSVVANRVYAGPASGPDGAASFRSLVAADIPDLSGTYSLTSHNHTGVYAPISHTHAASDIVSGTIATARLGSGTANGSTVLRGDQTWGAVPAAGSTTQVMFNDAGSFGGDAGMVYDKTTDTLTVGILSARGTTLGDWFDQSVKTTASPTFASVSLVRATTVSALLDLYSGDAQARVILNDTDENLKIINYSTGQNDDLYDAIRFYTDNDTTTHKVSIRRLGGMTVWGGVRTASSPILDLTQTWNSGGTTFTSFLVSITSTASAAASLFADFQLDGVSKFSVGKAGDVVAAATITAGTNILLSGSLIFNGSIPVYRASSEVIALDSAGLEVAKNLVVNRATTYATNAVPLRVRSTSGQTAHLQDWENDAGGVLASISASGVGAFFSVTLGSAGTLAWSTDLSLSRDAAHVLALKDGTNQNTLRVYGDTSGRYFYATHVTTNAYIGTNVGGVRFVADGTNQWEINQDTYYFGPLVTGTLDFGASAYRIRSGYFGGNTVTTSTPVLDIAQTWNSGGTTFTGILANFTSTASASTSLLMDLQVGSASKFSVGKAGDVVAVGTIQSTKDYVSELATNIRMTGSIPGCVWETTNGSGRNFGVFNNYANNGYLSFTYSVSAGGVPSSQWLTVNAPGSAVTANLNWTFNSGLVTIGSTVQLYEASAAVLYLGISGTNALRSGTHTVLGNIEFANGSQTAFIRNDSSIFYFGSSSNYDVYLYRNNSVMISFSSDGAGSYAMMPQGIKSIGHVNNRLSNLVVGKGSAITASDPAIDLMQVWNNAGVAFTAFEMNVTNTASAAASLLMDLQVGSASKFSVDKDGYVAAGFVTAPGGTFSGGIGLGAAQNDPSEYLQITRNGNPIMAFRHIGTAGAGNIGYTNYYFKDNGGTERQCAYFGAYEETAHASLPGVGFRFYTADAGGSLQERLRLTQTGELDLVMATGELRINGTKVVDSRQTGRAALGAGSSLAGTDLIDATALRNELDAIRASLDAERTITNAHGLTTVV